MSPNSPWLNYFGKFKYYILFVSRCIPMYLFVYLNHDVITNCPRNQFAGEWPCPLYVRNVILWILAKLWILMRCLILAHALCACTYYTLAPLLQSIFLLPCPRKLIATCNVYASIQYTERVSGCDLTICGTPTQFLHEKLKKCLNEPVK